MRKTKLTPIIFATLVAFMPSTAHPQTTCKPQQRKELVATVVDKTGSVVDNLRAEQLSLKIGKSLATISDVKLQNNSEPLDVVILIDASVSQEKALPLAKAGAHSFISSGLSAGRDRVAIVPFSSTPTSNPALTSDFAGASASIDQIQTDRPLGYVGGGVVVGTSPPRKVPIPGSTSLWDVIGSTNEALFGAGTEKRRRVMLLFSDGNDTSSSSKQNRVTDDLIKHDVAVFSIGLAGDPYGASEGTLKKLSEQTGGVASFPKKKEAVETLITAIGKRLQTSYVVGYCGELKSGDKLQLEVVDPELRKQKPTLTYKRS